ncbi:NlpC/P60 family protein [Vibrio sp. WJH972]
MEIRQNGVILIFSMFLLVGCSMGPEREGFHTATSSPKREILGDSESVKQRLLGHYGEWKGTPYVYGGLSSRGVDCSGFVYLTFLERLGLTLPRTTSSQVKVGIKVSPRKMKVGDLVFFKTGFNTRHVGIYLGDNQFLHASESKGVIISFLTNPYWQSHFWQVRRVMA